MESVIKINNGKCEPSFYKSVMSEINEYASKWKLSCLELIDDGKESCVLKCYSAEHGNVILKMRRNIKVIEDEFNTLVEYNGRCFCNVFDGEVRNGIFLEEQVQPGTELKKVESLDKRLSIFCSLHKKLHIKPTVEENYPTYLDWVSKITRYMETREDYKELYIHIKKAESLCKELFVLYPTKMLLHGDLHHHNILLNSMNEYTIIDPKGVLGDPIFDIPRFILNEMEDEINQELYEKIQYIITMIGKQLSIPIRVLEQLFYIEITMAECWNVEDGTIPSMLNVMFAENILNSNAVSQTSLRYAIGEKYGN